jgi:ATP-dependent DNA ligase
MDQSEGSRPHLGALLLGYHTDDGKLVYAGQVGTGMSEKVLKDLAGVPGPLKRSKSPLSAPPPRSTRFGVAARPVPRPLGGAEACRRDQVFDVDG